MKWGQFILYIVFPQTAGDSAKIGQFSGWSFFWTGALEDERVELDNKSYVASQSIYYIVERWDSMQCMVKEMGREANVFQQHTGKTQRVI